MKDQISNTPNLILVDENDNVIGSGEKLETHRRADLHRAFSIFVYDYKNNKLLVQKRAHDKYHSGGLWSNSVCSHPYFEETESEMLSRGLADELGFIKDFKILEKDEVKNLEDIENTMIHLGKFKYFTDYGEMKEHEIDNVYLYMISDPEEIQKLSTSFSPDEISKIKWFSPDELKNLYERKSDNFSSWYPYVFKMTDEFIDTL